MNSAVMPEGSMNDMVWEPIKYLGLSTENHKVYLSQATHGAIEISCTWNECDQQNRTFRGP